MDIQHLSIEHLREKLAEDSFSLEDLSSAVEQRCNNIQKHFNAFTSLNSYLSSDIKALKGFTAENSSLPLAGVPYILEDTICTTQMKSTCSSKFLSSFVPPFDAHVHSILREKGAVLTGKGNTEEFALGSSGDSSYFSSPLNPWNKENIAGSGAAAAVSAGGAVIGLGVDTNGELRQSAAFNGVFALKPSYGKISRRGVIGYSPSLEQVGIYARSTPDLATALEHITVLDEKDPTCIKSEIPSYTSLLREILPTLTVAVPEDWETSFVHKATAENFKRFIEQLRNFEIEVKYVPLNYYKYSSTAASVISAVEAFSTLSNLDGVRFGLREEGKHLQDMYLQTRSNGFSSKLKKFLGFGALASREDYYNPCFRQSQKLRSLIKQEIEDCLNTYDLLLTPTTPFASPALNESKSFSLPEATAYYTSSANLTGYPALQMPLTAPGTLPLGVQFLGQENEEVLLLKLSFLLEKEMFLYQPEI